MSIYAYVGLPGSGKSYNVVANVILPALRDGRRVVTNVPLYRDVVMAADGVKGELVEFPISQVVQDPELFTKFVTHGSVFVLDEVWKLWPSGLKTADIPDVYKTVLAEHRHMTDSEGRSIHIVLAVQDLGSVAVFARKLVDQTFIHRKMGDLGAEGRYRVDIYSGAVTGYMGSDKMFIRSVFGEYSKEVWQFYNSHTKAVGVGGGVGGEKSIDRRGNRFKAPFFVFGIPLAISCGIFAVWHLKKRGDEMMHPKPVPQQVRSENHPGFVDTALKPASRPILGDLAAPRRTSFRVLGFIEVPGQPERSKALLISDAGQKVTRAMTHCRYVDTDFFECQIDGEWYGQAGGSLVSHADAAVVVSLPVAAQNFNPPIAPVEASPTSVARGEAVDAVVDSSLEHHLKPAGIPSGPIEPVLPRPPAR
jgi:zona occludens toxin